MGEEYKEDKKMKKQNKKQAKRNAMFRKLRKYVKEKYDKEIAKKEKKLGRTLEKKEKIKIVDGIVNSMGIQAMASRAAVASVFKGPKYDTILALPEAKKVEVPQVENSKKEIEEKEEIKENITEENAPEIIEESKEEIKEEVKEEMRSQSEVFNTVMSQWDDSSNPLKNTFQIKVKNIEKINDTAKKIQAIPNVTTVRYGEGMVEKMVSAFKWIERIAYGAVIALVLVTVFLIINTIKLTIFSRKKEIEIMRLVGASNFVIKTPFVIEGMFLGLLGSIVPVLIIIFGYTSLYDYSSGYVFSPLIQLIKPIPFIYYASLIIVGLGIVVGMIGSATASRKYLKV